MRLQLVDPVAGRRRAGERRPGGGDHRRPFAGLEQIDLGEHEQLRPLGQPAAVQPQLAVDRVAAAHDLGRVGARLDEVDQEPRPLEVGQELVPEPDPGARALEQAGHVGDGQLAAVVGLDRAEHGLDRS